MHLIVVFIIPPSLNEHESNFRTYGHQENEENERLQSKIRALEKEVCELKCQQNPHSNDGKAWCNCSDDESYDDYF